MGQRAQLPGRRAAHQALTRTWNTCIGQVRQAFSLGDRSLQDTEASFPTCNRAQLTFPLRPLPACDFWGPNSRVSYKWGVVWLWISDHFCRIVEETPLSFPWELTQTDASLDFTTLCPLLLTLQTTSGSTAKRQGCMCCHPLAEHSDGMKGWAWDPDFPVEPAPSRTKDNRYKPQISSTPFLQVVCKLTTSCCALKLLKRGMVTHLPFPRGLIPAAAVQCFPVCSSRLCFGWTATRQNKLGAWADAPCLQIGFKLFYSEMLIIFLQCIFLRSSGVV